MSSSYTTRKRYEKQNPGENNNTWGGFLNSNTIDLLDESFGVVSVNCGSTTGDITLGTANGATDEGRRSILKIYGTPASAISLFVPAQQSFYFVRGAHTTQSVNVKCAGGTIGVKFDAGESGVVVANGTQVREIFRTPSAGTFNGVPSGSILAWSGTASNLPAGYVICDGTNSTPNLSERFILGTTSTGGVGRTGGAILLTTVSANISVGTVTGSTVLTSANIPAHAHYMFAQYFTNTDSDQLVNTALANVRVAMGNSGYSSGTSFNYMLAGQVTTAPVSIGQTSWAYTSDATGHTHTIALEAGHKHTITDGRPPYYSLIYIMKS